ncbi:MAG: hypothetical protein PVS2B1_09220 [Candidatus Dormibacteraceae bacterium]
MRHLTHLWQRFLLASSLLVGLLVGVGVTVFGYGNKTAVDVHWWAFHIAGVPLWMVAVVPVGVVLVAGTLYHWMDGLHHFTEHMRHRHRVHELEAEVASLKAHLDQVLDMPDHSTSRLSRKAVTVEPLPPVEAPAAEVAPATSGRFSRPKRASLAAATEPAPSTTAVTNGGHEATATEAP